MHRLCRAHLFGPADRRIGEHVRDCRPRRADRVHTPEICYSTQDYRVNDARERLGIQDAKGQEDQFWALSFQSKHVEEQALRVCYAWSTGNHWSAPNDGRFAFAGQPYLYKVQLSATLPTGTDLKTSDTCQEFLKDFVPVLRQYLIEPSKR